MGISAMIGMDISGQVQLWQSAMQSTLALTEVATQAFSSVATETARQTTTTWENIATAPTKSQGKQRTRAKSWYRDPRQTSPFDLWLKACSPANLFSAGAVQPWSNLWSPTPSWQQSPLEIWTAGLANFAGTAFRQWGTSGHPPSVGQTEIIQAIWPAAPVWPSAMPAMAWGDFNRSICATMDLQTGMARQLRPTIWF